MYIVCNNCEHKKHISLGAIFVQANVDEGCCTADGEFHRRCLYVSVNDQEQCKSLCALDTGCKGFVMKERDPNYNYYDDNIPNNNPNNLDYCQLATTSLCPSPTRGPFDVNNVQSLDSNAYCLHKTWNGYIYTTEHNTWNGGCYIKQGL